jgi:SRSO17 transposase
MAEEKKRFVDEFPKTYDKVKDLNNELDGYAILHYFCNGIEIDETSAKHLETLRELTSKAVDVAHELMEHLAWDKY